MKINNFLVVMSTVMSALLAYGFFSYSSSENQLILTLGSFVCFTTTLIMAVGLNFDTDRGTTNIRALSLFFFIVFLVLNIVSAFFDISKPVYIISSGVVLSVFLMSFYGIKRATE